MKRINFEDGTLKTPGYATDASGNHLPITEAEYEGNTPLSAFLLNELQDNIEDATNIQKATIVTTAEIPDNTDYTIPLKYKVGNNSLEINYMGEKLVKSTDTLERSL